MNDSYRESTAEIKLGGKTINVSMHKEMAEIIEQSKNSLLDCSHEVANVLSRLLDNRLKLAYIKIGTVQIPVELPAYLIDSLECYSNDSGVDSIFEEHMGQVIRAMIPTRMRPPTERQVHFAKKIARILNIELANGELDTFDSCSNFIEENKPAFDIENDNLRDVYRAANQAARGVVCLSLYRLDLNTCFILEIMRVSQIKTLNKYIANFVSFYDFYTSQEARIVNILLEEVNIAIGRQFEDYDLPLLVCTSQLIDELMELLNENDSLELF